ncbi:glycosyltransferase [Aeromonas veronii]|uniref:glycosyltransferase n=1 Tax=Aeromonas TaxID=642 RepID=UPI00208FA8C3|nr:glycosyltransferase [Aeromonas caviae]MDX7648989.1 glycosyltransferase [Aeromonas caviae]MDX7821957.1 glycosyltransferase [Aeromonas caviae]USP61110.1 glycosyltransferase [Aeromonas caviae]
MKKLMFLCSRMPYPPIGGDRAKNYNLLKKLALKYKLHVVVITSEDVTSEQVAFLESVGEYKVFKKSKFDFLASLLKGVFRLPIPLQCSLYFFSDVNRYIQSYSNNVDAIFCTLVRTAEYARLLKKTKLCDMADSIGQNYQKSAETVASSWKSLYYKFESKLLIKYEQTVVDHFDGTFLFNLTEIDNFKNKQRITWIPHGVNEKLLTYPIVEEKKNAFSFLGKMDYQPNIDAVLWFAKHILNRLPADVNFYIVGASPTAEVKALAERDSRVVITGFMDDPFDFISKTKFSIAPMVSGGGIQNKVLETMALGLPNIMSPLAAKPMVGLEDTVYSFIAKDNEDWIRLISQLLEDDVCRKSVQIAAREYIQQSFTWSSSAEKYIEVIESCIDRKEW